MPVARDNRQKTADNRKKRWGGGWETRQASRKGTEGVIIERDNTRGARRSGTEQKTKQVCLSWPGALKSKVSVINHQHVGSLLGSPHSISLNLQRAESMDSQQSEIDQLTHKQRCYKDVFSILVKYCLALTCLWGIQWKKPLHRLKRWFFYLSRRCWQSFLNSFESNILATKRRGINRCQTLCCFLKQTCKACRLVTLCEWTLEDLIPCLMLLLSTLSC